MCLSGQFALPKTRTTYQQMPTDRQAPINGDAAFGGNIFAIVGSVGKVALTVVQSGCVECRLYEKPSM